MTVILHASIDERRATGRTVREKLAPSGHSGWEPAADRPDPVPLLEEQNTTREANLVPARHGRMLVSPFTFYRGAAKIMAADLKDTPTAGLNVQLCGDAHLSNFEAFASPERWLLFGLNDFDETPPGPSNTTSSVWPPASPSRRETTVSAKPTCTRRPSPRSRPTGNA